MACRQSRDGVVDDLVDELNEIAGDPEYYFDDRDPSDYRLFGIRYLILPARDQPPVRAQLAMRSGPYSLWTIGGTGYVQAGQIVGEISANRTNVGTRSVPLLDSGLAADGAYLGVRYGPAAGMARCRRCEASPPPARSARNAPTSMAARPRRRCGCASPESRCSAPPMTPGGRQP
jgi:hypothetical protein